MRVLIAGLGDHKEFGLKSLQRAGYFVGVIDLPHRIPIDLCDWWRGGDRFSLDSMYEQASSAEFSWDAVICWEELSTDIARAMAKRLGVPSPRMPDGNFRDKGIMHAVVKQHHPELTPNLGVGDDVSECRRLAEGNYPVVVKPTDYGGSGGVQIVETSVQLDAAVLAALEPSVSNRVSVDRYMDGPEYSVEAITWGPGRTQVVTVTAKHLTPPPYCVEIGHLVPAPITDETRAMLEDATLRVLDALGMEAGISHSEFRVTPKGPVLMEVAGRPAGDQIPRLVELATGVNLNIAEVETLLGPSGSPSHIKSSECSAIRFLVGDGVTPFRFPLDEENVNESPFASVVREVRYFSGEGTVSSRPTGPGGRLGQVVLAGQRSEVATALDAFDGRKQIYSDHTLSGDGGAGND